MRIINHDSKRCQGGIESVGYVPETVQGAQKPGNYVDISLWEKKRIMKYIRPMSQPPSREAEQCDPNPFANVINCFEHFNNSTSN